MASKGRAAGPRAFRAPPLILRPPCHPHASTRILVMCSHRIFSRCPERCAVQPGAKSPCILGGVALMPKEPCRGRGDIKEGDISLLWKLRDASAFWRQVWRIVTEASTSKFLESGSALKVSLPAALMIVCLKRMRNFCNRRSFCEACVLSMNVLSDLWSVRIVNWVPRK